MCPPSRTNRDAKAKENTFNTTQKRHERGVDDKAYAQAQNAYLPVQNPNVLPSTSSNLTTTTSENGGNAITNILPQDMAHSVMTNLNGANQNSINPNATATSYVQNTNNLQQQIPFTASAAQATHTTTAANLMPSRTAESNAFLSQQMAAEVPASTAVATQQLLTNAILSNWQQQQQFVQSAPQGNVVTLPLTLPNIGNLSMGVSAVGNPLLSQSSMQTDPLLPQAPSHTYSSPLAQLQTITPLVLQTPSHPLSLQLSQLQIQQAQLNQTPINMSNAAPAMMLTPLINTPLPNPPALTIQDVPLHQPVYNGINPNYPNLRVLHQHPPVFAVDDFLTQTECDFLISVAQDSFTAAPVVGKGAGEVSPSRTSSTCYLAREDLPLLLQKVTELTGKPAEHCELPQVGRYLPSQQYLQHFDAFDLTNEDGRRFAANGGQRTVTVLIYLNDVKNGGHTSFPALKLDVQPKRGTALVFFPSTVDGLLDKNALHAAKPAVDVKYVSQVWIRQGNYEGFPSKRMFTSAEQARIVQKSLISAREGMDPSFFKVDG